MSMNITQTYKAVLVIAFVSLLALKRAIVHVRVSFNITALTVGLHLKRLQNIYQS